MHVVNVTIEADAFLGPLLGSRAQARGCVYSTAYGYQPVLICDSAEWARTSGFRVVCADKGKCYLPAYHASTPETALDCYGITAAARRAGINAKTLNSFLDGTKSTIEMAAVTNAWGLPAPLGGLSFSPASRDELTDVPPSPMPEASWPKATPWN